MSVDDIAKSFRRRLEEKTAAHHKQAEDDLQALKQMLLGQLPPTSEAAVARLRSPQGAPSPVQPLLNLGGTDWLNELDGLFAETFGLARYTSTEALHYPTVYCESLKEFFTPLARQLSLSEQAREEMLVQMVAEAEETAQRTQGGGMFGYALPGIGCYLNGWLLTYGTDLTPREGLHDPELRLRIAQIAVHEKLGHGFLAAYSALGQVKSQLGLFMREIASRFGLKAAETATDKLREEQARLLFLASQLVEEGWATWLESFLPGVWRQQPRRTTHQLEKVVDAVKHLPRGVKNRKEVQNAFLTALTWLFGEDPITPGQALQAVAVVETTGSDLDDYFSAALGQPLRYAVGELLLLQAEANVGAYAVPYLVLIAANVDPQPESVALSDLRDLLFSRPEFNPDARLALLSRLRLKQPNGVAELARLAESQLSLTVPPMLK